jgi:signal transduction histidine kinase
MNDEKLLETYFEKELMTNLGQLLKGFMHKLNGPLNNLYLLADRIARTEREIDQLISHNESCDLQSLQEISMGQLRRTQQLSEQLAVLTDMVRDFRVLQDLMHQSKVDLKMVLSRVLELCRCDLSVKYEVRLELDLGKDLPLIHIPGSKLIPAFMHLCQNAITTARKAEQKIVMVSCRKEAEIVRVQFRSSACEPTLDQDQDPFLQLYYTYGPARQSADDRGSRHLWLFAVQDLLGPYGVEIHMQAAEHETATVVHIPVSVQRLL